MAYRMRSGLGSLLLSLIGLYEFIIFARCIMSFLCPDSRIYYLSVQITEPLLGPVRRALERIVGSFRLDFSPYIAFLLLDLVRRIIIRIF